MNRITEIEIAGKTYPLNFSTKAAKLVAERYGEVSNVGAAFKDKSVDKMMDEVIWLIALLIQQGVAYKRIAEGAAVDGITAEELEVVVGVADFASLKDQLMGAMLSGMGRTVEVQPGKNAETTQGN